MKKVSEHLGQIIVALAAIALLVCAVVFFRAPLGNFFGSIVDKTTSIGEEVLVNMDDMDVTNLNGGNGSGGTSALPESGVDPATREITDSWDQIQQAISEGVYATRYQTGDTKTINMGTYGDVVMQIVAFDADTKADGSGTAAITWLSKDLIAKHVMNTENTNAGGWEASEMRSWLRTEVYGALPTEVQSAIVTVNKTYYDYADGAKTTETCEDNVWIPSYLEIRFGGDGFETSGATYTAHFTSKEDLVKNYSGSAAMWWLRSANGNENVFTHVSSHGYISGSNANSSYGVVLGFCTGSGGSGEAGGDGGDGGSSESGGSGGGGGAVVDSPHITKSSGNGYALYNGVKLPKLPEWDREMYPYAVIYYYDAGMVDSSLAGQKMSMLLLISVQGYYTGGYAVDGSHKSKSFCVADSQEVADVFGDIMGVSIPVGVWGSMVEDETTDDLTTTYEEGASFLWSNHDILNKDGTLYLAASDPIPLDGMTVIEWDGDTTGLVNMGIAYKVAEYENASSAVCVYSTGDVRSEITRDTENSWFVGEGTGAIHEEDVEAAGSPESGIYMGAGNGNYCSLLAYYPIE